MTIKEISVSGVTSCKSKIGGEEIQVCENGEIKIVIVEDKCPPRTRDINGVRNPVVSLTPRAKFGFQNGLVAYYPFNGDTNDASGNGHHGMVALQNKPLPNSD